MKRNRFGTLMCAVAIGVLSFALAGCSPHYHLVGNQTWSSPAPQPRDTGVNLPSNTPAGGPYGDKGPTPGNTSFAHP
jgi:hypothetical protein